MAAVPDYEIILDKPRKLRIDFRAKAAYCRRYDETVFQAALHLYHFEAGNKDFGFVDDARLWGLLWCGLLDDAGGRFSEEKVADLIVEALEKGRTLPELATDVFKALAAFKIVSMPATEETPPAEPQQETDQGEAQAAATMS